MRDYWVSNRKYGTTPVGKQQGPGLSYPGFVTALEAYDLTTKGGGGDFARVIAACESFGPYCLIEGLAVNCYVEPVYTLDADFVVVAQVLQQVVALLEHEGFTIRRFSNSVNAQTPISDLRVQFTTDQRYQEFPARSQLREVLGVQTRVACLEDVVRGKLWAYSGPQRRLSKRKKDELDLIRLAEAYPELRELYPKELLDQLAGF